MARRYESYPPHHPKNSTYGVGRLTGTLYMRINIPVAGVGNMVCIAPGPKSDQKPGDVSYQDPSQIDWFAEGTKLELWL